MFLSENEREQSQQPQGVRPYAAKAASKVAHPAIHRKLFADVKSSTDLAQQHENKYYPLKEYVIPEAFDQWYKNRFARPSKIYSSEGGGQVVPVPHFVAGCTGLQQEFAQSWYPYIMYRSAFRQLWEQLTQPNDMVSQRYLVMGAPGSGKSVMLAATVEYLRQAGWIVLYIPDAQDITMRNMFYSKNLDTGMFDTRDAAQNILRALAEAHGEQLRQLPQQVEGGSGTLLDLCSLPDSASDATLCNAVVRLKLELYKLPASQRSAVVVDNYNALFWKTAFREATALEQPTRPIDAQELTLGANLRALTDTNIGGTAVLVGTSTSGSVPSLPVGLKGAAVDYIKMTLPLMDVRELHHMLQYYRYVEALSPSQLISEKGVEAAHQLTQGNGHDVKRFLHYLLPYDPQLNDMDKIGEMYAGKNLAPAA